MGNLLGAPVTDKETITGKADPDLEYGMSSMQGWRVHMEDAHICEPRLYATDTSASGQQARIELPGHSLFAVFDGHGGTFAAKYSGANLCRILAKQPKFVEYAKFFQELQKSRADATLLSSSSPAEQAQFLRSGMEALEEAFRATFVEVDQEIALAVNGTAHPDANQPYHKPDTKLNKSDESSAANNSTTADTNMEDAALAAAATHASALDDEGDSGTTAVCVLVTPDWIVCANAGDSRALYCTKGRPHALSHDHKPDDEAEERRIRAAGGYVAGGRVEGDLAVSRGLGDFRFKHLPTVSAGYTGSNTEPSEGLMRPVDQKVSPIPDLIVQTRNTEEDEFIIVACDGIWDVRSNLECTQDVQGIFQEGENNLGLLCEEMLDHCLAWGSKDNMTILVVKFPAQVIGEGGGVIGRRQEREAKEKSNDEDSKTDDGGHDSNCPQEHNEDDEDDDE